MSISTRPSPDGRRLGSKVLGLATTALLAAAVVVGGGAIAQAAPAPSITVSEAPDGGGAVIITGSGFSTTDPGVYVGLGNQAASGFYSATLVGSETVWVDAANASGGSSGARTEPMSAQGTFSFTITAPAGTDSSYAVFSSKAHGLGARTDLTQNVTVSLHYATPAVVTPSATPTAVPTTPGTPTPITPGTGTGPRITATQIPTAGGTITLTGKGFSATSPGIYLGVGPVGLAGIYGATGQLIDSQTIWIDIDNVGGTTALGRTAPMTAAGTFSVTVTLPAKSNVTYAVYTSKAHGLGVTNTSQNTVTQLSYVGQPVVTPPVANPADPVTPAVPDAPEPSISVSKVPARGGNVTVTGKNFSAQSPGIYLGVGAAGYDGFYPASRAGALITSQTTWIAIDKTASGSLTAGASITAAGPTVPRTAHLNADGSFSVTVTLPAPNGTSYAIYTSLASGIGSLDASQNALAPLSYVAAAVAVPTPAAEEEAPKCVARAVSGATLDWAIKTSFRSYISGSIANGKWSLSGVGDDNGRFVWSAGDGTYNTSASKGVIRFPGTLRFTGHDGALDITITDMSVRFSSSGAASVVASFATLGLDGKRTSMSTVPFATIAAGGTSIGSSSLRVTDASTALTANGATAFGGFYPTGQALAPLTLSAPLGASVECDSATFSSLALTGTTSPDASLIRASALMLAGIGMLVIMRRRRAGAAATASAAAPTTTTPQS